MAAKPQLPCRAEDPELWFPVGKGALADEQAWLAKQLCHACQIEQACLKYALETGQLWGVWGGTDPTERRAIQRRDRINQRGDNEDHRTRTDLVRELAS